MRKFLIASLFGFALSSGVIYADEVIRVRPPAAIVETRPAAPGPNYVWQPGYHRWDGGHYVWTPGVWAARPHPGAGWVAGHYAHRGGGWVFVEGHWR
jgi:hypothetical protein